MTPPRSIRRRTRATASVASPKMSPRATRATSSSMRSQTSRSPLQETPIGSEGRSSRFATRSAKNEISIKSDHGAGLRSKETTATPRVARGRATACAETPSWPNDVKKGSIRKSTRKRILEEPEKEAVDKGCSSLTIGQESCSPKKSNKEFDSPESVTERPLANVQAKLGLITCASELVGYEKDVSFLRTVIRNCLNCIDSNSVLICGGRGSGKTTLLEHCLRSEDAESKATILRLNGHVDASETNAFRSIGREMDIHETDLSTMMSVFLEKCGQSKETAIIILDAFDIFCTKNQTLLYNLFDLTQKCTCICIIGMTTRLDCIELLEKRVKSRMNHTVIHLTSPFKGLDDYMHYAVNLFYRSIGQGIDPNANRVRKVPPKSKSTCVVSKVQLQLPQDLSILLKRNYSRTKSICDLKRCLLTYLVEGSLQERTKKLADTDSTCQDIGSLSVLELAVLILAVKHAKNKNEVSFNCNNLMNYLHEIPAQMKITKSLLMKAINNLMDYGLILASSRAQKATLYLTEWTTLTLNVDENHVRTSLKTFESTLPVKMMQLLSTQ
ncbi:Origin recognition complex subunit 4 [Halotydeus destructor]|nr:Origin recognition complex subunit 4 [Halotydeus destructor]